MAEETTLSRRKLIKRAGVGAAAVWSVPFLTSTASAGVGIETLRQACTNTDKSPACVSCGAQSCATKNGTTCFCFVGVRQNRGSGCCECQGNYFCSGARPCNSNGDCPTGFKCVVSCCGQTCAPKCGQGISAAQASLGRTAAG
jgi:hypothetical protein